VLCRRQGIECVAEQLVASEEGLFYMAFVVHCYDFDSYFGENVQNNFSVISFDESLYHPLS